MKKVFLSILPVLAVLIAGCRQNTVYRHAEGAVWGTVYHITYKSDCNLDDSIVAEMQRVNMSLSAFEPGSTLSLINAGKTDTVDALFEDVYRAAADVYDLSSGLYDPTVGPLVNLWGFGSHGDCPEPTAAQVDSARTFVGFNRTHLDGNRVVCDTTGMYFDFSSIAKGYGIDRIAAMLRRNGCENYLVEIGGEVSAAGANPLGQPWVIAIEQPIAGTAPGEKTQRKVLLQDKCMATSGNYRNYRQRADGTSYGHTINPLSGYPMQTELLSVTVVAPTCIQADALATALMTMTENGLKKIAASLPTGIEVFYTVATEGGPEMRELNNHDDL